MQSQTQIGGVTVVFLETAGMSPLSTKVVEEIHAACDMVDDIAGDRALIIRINGREEQQDPSPWPGDVDLQLVSQWEKALRRIERIDACTIATATRHCSAAALEILLAADYRIGTSDLCIQLSYRGEIMWPGMSVHRLVGRIGLNESRRLLMFGGELHGVGAADVGILDEIVSEQGELSRASEKLLKSVTAGGYSLRRQLLLEASSSTYEDALGIHLAACDRELRRRRRRAESISTLEQRDEPNLV